ncbi:murein DD-endopeptidase MepM/ murein hydrolase activator NlpD [Ochrobactrum intermedium]|uniref:Murein DD-endopeptidase MepM/ murein hydrolase activator NlpD n=1 Tax=Brucella intermedia TaxID=94625 RepID=A0ABR6AL81_9HYPH|nr:M23 family metallopeptidase [Brucella intermedia]MBA8850143.1 murein DD-endopeptidase MepM/ murein hydrolase activator NlpD [Brucella intermedia]MPR63686.1 M23 family metallopeptidase [Brucella intermedia]WLF97250.1 M23 family metallopeptidase [Brucella intermedia]
MVFGSAKPSAPASETQSAETAERELAAFGTALKGEPLSSKSLKPFRQVRFSLHTHLRFCLALMAATAIAGGGLLFATGLLVRHGHAAQPVLVNPATLVHTHAAPKEARLTPAMSGDPASAVSRRIDIAEGVEDGDARLYTYQHVVLDLKGQSRAQIDDTLHGAVSAQKSLSKRPEEELERGVPINVSLAKPASATGAKVHEIIVAPQSRERLGALLQAAGIAVEDSKRLEEALARTELVPGDNLELLVDKSRQHTDGEQHIALARFEHGDIGKAIYGRADDGVFRATGDERLFARLSRDAMLTAYSPQGAPDSSGSIASRLGQAGAPKAIIDEIGKLAAQNGVSLDGAGKPDLIDLLFRRSAETEPELVFVEFTTGGKSRRLYRHESENGTGYFNEDGSSMAKYLMPKPLPNGRLNDGFGWRVHPVLHVRKHHNGVDYDAPIGSPIVAAGDGVVELISYQKGYGKYVRIRHQGGYSTTYAHLSSARRGLKPGEHVKQGDVIAYVGSTGYSTGPHLYYELKVGDQYVNPLTARLNAGEKLTGSSLNSFREEIDHVGQIVNEMKLPVIPNAPESTKPASGKGSRHR